MTVWLLACGHVIPLLEHESHDLLPTRPRMCPVCRKPREVKAAGLGWTAAEVRAGS